ncbi:tumor necrosis factor alpha-induced protein 3-like [Lytechinus variegatus]|uniref:tumor necrosis factor alpha-induced protein 3-like n=1 Tax=Lytechinus variegatus TaxID=7654 RepID=UPI001BB12A6D|nr:tumor necrosis factor alpha-induced protein 3-like [Lytechinus variegatus]
MTPHPEDNITGSQKRSPLGLPLKVGDADHTKTNRIWSKVRDNLRKAPDRRRPTFLAEMPYATAILPYCWQLFAPDFNKYMRQELCDIPFGHFLEEKKILNWCPVFTKLYPLNATGDGNCLLHAISLALWGVEDTDLWLRKVLHTVMRGEFAGANESRWRRERNLYDAKHMPGQGFRYNTKEWTAEWKIVVDIASPERRIDQTLGLPYECLEEFHIFIMANILRRPIIVVAENMWRDAAGKSLQPMNFNGIYLPLGWDPKECVPHPILLGYHQMHFSPLLCTSPSPYKKEDKFYCVPLVDHVMKNLPIHFLKPEEEGQETRLLQMYLICEEVGIGDRPIMCARLATDPPKEEMDVFQSYLNVAETRYRMYSEEQHNPENAEALKAAGMMSAISTQQLNEKLAAAGDSTLTRHPGHDSKVEPSVASTGRSPLNDAFDMETEESIMISSTALLSSGIKAPPSDAKNTRYSTGTTLVCKNPGCHYLRVLASDEYCERCYKAMSSVGKQAFKKCRVDSCLNGGERKYEGLCQVCYDQNTFMNEDTAPTRHPTSLKDLSTSPKFYGLNARGPVIFDPATKQDGNGMEVDEDKTSDNMLNTNVVNEFTVGSKQCTSPGCEFTGNPNYDGLCSKCFKDKIGLEQQNAAGSEALGYLDRSPPQEIPLTVGKKKCIMPECELTGHPEKGDLCSGCFSRQTEIGWESGLPVKTKDKKPQPLPDKNIPGISRGFSAERQKQLLKEVPQQCCTPKCEMYAHPSQNGLCSACYKESIAGRSSPLDTRRALPLSQRKRAKDQEGSSYRPILQFTVQKNMCAIPGCNGVRLQIGSGDLCRTHYEESSRRYSPTTTTPSPSGAFTRTGMPSVGGRVQPSAPPQSIYASQSGYRSNGVSNHREVPQAVEPSQMARTTPEICSHPCCKNPAVPPTYIACRRCLSFVDKVNQMEAAIKSVHGEGAVSKTPAVRKALENDEMSPIALETGRDPYDPPTETVRNLDIHEKPSSAGIKGQFQYDYIKRVKCQAVGGCPYNMYGNPQYGNLCTQCFDREVVLPRQKNFTSSSAPLKKSSRSSHTLPPKSQSAVISGTSTTSRSAARASNYQKCSSQDCHNQANPQIMEGYCNDCYPAYKDKKKSRASAGARDRSAPSSRTSKRELLLGQQDDIFPISAPRCHNDTCSNFGNDQCRGYCNGCFRKLMNQKDLV